MGKKIMKFSNINDYGQFKVTINLNVCSRQKQFKFKTFEEAIKKIKGKDKHFVNEVCNLNGKVLTYKSETLLPRPKSCCLNKNKVLFVFGNPATHSVKNRMFFFSKTNGHRHQIWGKLENAGLLDNIKLSNRKKEAENRKLIILNGGTKKKFIIGLTVFYSFPTPVDTVDAKTISKYCDAKGVEKIFEPIISQINEEEYERIKSYCFSKGAILVFTNKNSFTYVSAKKDPIFKKILYWPMNGRKSKESSGIYLKKNLDKSI